VRRTESQSCALVASIFAYQASDGQQTANRRPRCAAGPDSLICVGSFDRYIWHRRAPLRLDPPQTVNSTKQGRHVQSQTAQSSGAHGRDNAAHAVSLELWRLPLVVLSAAALWLSVESVARAQVADQPGTPSVVSPELESPAVAPSNREGLDQERVGPDGQPRVPGPAVDTRPTPRDGRAPDRRAERSGDTRRSPILRLASVPNMFGDFFNHGGQVVATAGAWSGVADTPTAGGARRLKISENNKALTMDRVYFMFNHFHNALSADIDYTGPFPAWDFSVDRYTLGFEKSLLDDLWSVDVRLPIVDRYHFTTNKLSAGGEEMGNLAVTVKRQLMATDTTAWVAGLSIDTPTGSDVHGRAITTSFTLHNDAVHLSPFIGFLRAPNDYLFYHGFLQIDVPTGANRVDYSDSTVPVSGTFGVLTEQTLLHLDFSVGRWLYRNPDALLVTGLAPVVEFHYTSTLQDADLLGPTTIAGTTFTFGNTLNRVDSVQLTVGLHAELARHTTLRVGGVFPFDDDPDRPFDAEVQISVNRYF